MASKSLGSLVGAMSMGVILACCSGINIGLGGGTGPNDARPIGLPLVQGTFTGQNGKTVTGTASVFKMGSLDYILRLEGIITPEDPTLQVQLHSSDSFGSNGQFNFQLRAYTGTQNYTFTGTNPNLVFSNVNIYSASTSMPYGSAIFPYPPSRPTSVQDMEDSG